MKTLRILAIVLALSLMIGEVWRSYGAGREWLFILDDQIMGGFLLAAAIAVGRESPRRRLAFSAAWGTVAGMLYGSFFGKLLEPEKAQPGNWDVGVLTWLIGLAFATSLVGLWASMVLPSREA